MKRHWVRLTRTCNQRCVFCHDRQAHDGTTAPWEEIREELRAGRRAGCRRVVLSGGEPTLHPRFLKIIALAKAAGYGHIQAVTNGRMFCYADFLDQAVAAGLSETTFSIHGHTAALHEAQTRVPGSFIQAIAGLRNALARPGLIVSVDVVINKINIGRLRSILDFLMGLGVKEFDLLQMTPFGEAWRNRGRLFYDLNKHGPQLRRALEVSRYPGMTLWTNRLLPRYLDGFESLIQPPEKLHDEVRGRAGMFRSFWEQGRQLWCRGERCRYCFLEAFCQDLVVFLKQGRLAARRAPPCLASRPSQKILDKKAGMDMDAFIEFYIRHRYFHKGTGCRGCARHARCEGVSVARLRRCGPPKPMAAP